MLQTSDSQDTPVMGELEGCCIAEIPDKQPDAVIVLDIVKFLQAKIGTDYGASALPSFDGKRVPTSIEDFLNRIFMFGCQTPSCFVSILIHLDRVQSEVPGFRLSPINYQRFILLSIMTSSKFFEDKYYCNRTWSEIGGISLKEINSLELEFLSLLHFRLFVSESEYIRYVNLVTRAVSVAPVELSSRTSTASQELGKQTANSRDLAAQLVKSMTISTSSPVLMANSSLDGTPSHLFTPPRCQSQDAAHQPLHCLQVEAPDEALLSAYSTPDAQAMAASRMGMPVTVPVRLGDGRTPPCQHSDLHNSTNSSRAVHLPCAAPAPSPAFLLVGADGPRRSTAPLPVQPHSRPGLGVVSPCEVTGNCQWMVQVGAPQSGWHTGAIAGPVPMGGSGHTGGCYMPVMSNGLGLGPEFYAPPPSHCHSRCVVDSDFKFIGGCMAVPGPSRPSMLIQSEGPGGQIFRHYM